MLILTRRIQEAIKIGQDIEVTVLGIKGNQVRLGISAPEDIPVDRLEIAIEKAQSQELNSADTGSHT